MGIFRGLTNAVGFVSGTASTNQHTATTSGDRTVKKPRRPVDNLIVFLDADMPDSRTGVVGTISLRAVAAAFAQGLGEQGKKVCLVGNLSPNSPLDFESRCMSTADPNVDMVHEIHPSELRMLGKAYDYLVATDRAHYHEHYRNEAWKRWTPHAARFIIAPLKATSIPDSVQSRTFCVYPGAKEGALSLTYSGGVLAVHAGNRWAGESVSTPVPVLAYYHPKTPKDLLVAAILGVSDPRHHYIDHYAVKSYRRSLHRTVSKVSAVPGFVAGVGIIMAGVATFDMGLVAAAGGALPFLVSAGTLGLENRIKAQQFSAQTMTKRKVDFIYPPLGGERVQRSLSAPPLMEKMNVRTFNTLAAGTPTTRRNPLVATGSSQTPMIAGKNDSSAPEATSNTYASDLMWAKVCKRHDVITSRWNEYELDITKMLDAPLMTDYSCPQTAALHTASVEADDLKAVASDSALRGDQPLEVARALYAESVTRLEVAFNVAEAHARKKGIRGFAEAEQRKIARSKQLFAIALNAGSSDAERASALTQARKELDGVIDIPEKTVQHTLDAAKVRPLLNA